MDHFEVVGMSDIKVGDCVSWLNSHGWSYGKIQSEYELREFTKQVIGTYEWHFGINESLIPEGFAIVPTEPDFNMVRAACESKAVCDEGEHVSLSEYLDFSGENRTHIVTRQALRDAINAAPKPTDK
jgi:hypothetical protein